MKFRYAMVCSSNQNRSMEAHSLLKRQGFDVSSYGTGSHVKLPGPSLREPNVYDFGTPYKQMFDDLRRKDPDLYSLLICSFFRLCASDKNIWDMQNIITEIFLCSFTTLSLQIKLEYIFVCCFINKFHFFSFSLSKFNLQSLFR